MDNPSRSVRTASCLTADSRDGGLEGGGYLQKDCFFLSIPASEERLQPVSERAIDSDESSCLVPFGRLASRRAKRRRRLSNWRSPDSMLSAPWLAVRKAPVVCLASWFTSFCRSSWRSGCRGCRPLSTTTPPRRGLPLGHMPIELVSSFLVIGPLGPRSFSVCSARSLRVSWCCFKASCESSHTPNHRVACLLKWTVLSSTWMPRALVVLVLLLLLRTMASDLLRWSTERKRYTHSTSL